ncbi:MAG: hypothetical protein IPM45_02345 [Acidimicrobiales bacterium]|nr:hypothetical protein [Acidimicrobiales bacterium]
MAVLLVGAAGCGDDESEVVVPTAEALASTLVEPDDYDGDWSITAPPEGTEQALSGVVSREQQELLPRAELCDDASPESRQAVETLQWKAFRQLELAVEDPVQPPDDMEGHMVFVQEFLTSGDPEEIEDTFGLIREGMQACLGDFPAAGGEGPGTAEEMTVPDVGDDRFGVLVSMEEGGGGAEWLLHEMFVRQGPVLMLLSVTDIRAGDGVEPYYSIDDVGAMLQTAVDKL